MLKRMKNPSFYLGAKNYISNGKDLGNVNEGI